MEPTQADQFIAVTMTTEETVLLTVKELRELLGRATASVDEVVSLVEDTDVHHPALKAWFGFDKGEVHQSFTARPR